MEPTTRYQLEDPRHDCRACQLAHAMLAQHRSADERGTLIRLIADHAANADEARRWSAAVWARLRSTRPAKP